MNFFPSMDWNSKWDWENLDMFNSKATETLQKLQPTDWGIVDGEIDNTSFNLSAGKEPEPEPEPGSGSDLGLGSSAKSTISASTDCSSKQEIPTSTFTFEPFKSVPIDFSKKSELVVAGAELNDASPSSLEASVGSGEPLIGLKLGKRTYFENSSCTGSNSKTTSCFSANPPTSSASTARKTKISSSCPKGAVTPRCQVEGCNLDLSSAKEYHKKHRVCETHSKSSIVVIAGVERRFCQQCSRFHGLPEFDEKKRSCRRRLLDHNARRRKPQQETLHFNSTGLSSTSYDFKEPIFSSNVDAAPDFRRALSLLSTSTTTDSWGCSYEPDPEPTTLEHQHHHQQMHVSHSNMMSHHIMPHQVSPQGMPLASASEYWHVAEPYNHSDDARGQVLAASSAPTNSSSTNFQEIHIFKAPQETRFYSDQLN